VKPLVLVLKMLVEAFMPAFMPFRPVGMTLDESLKRFRMVLLEPFKRRLSPLVALLNQLLIALGMRVP